MAEPSIGSPNARSDWGVKSERFIVCHNKDGSQNRKQNVVSAIKLLDCDLDRLLDVSWGGTNGFPGKQRELGYHFSIHQ